MRSSIARIAGSQILLVAFAVGATAQTSSPGSIGSGYSQVVQPLFDLKCVSCHAGETAPKQLRLDGWDHLVEGGRHGEAIIPYDPDNSLLIELVTRSAHPSEVGADTLTSGEVARISGWIAAGAHSDTGVAPFSDDREFVYAPNEGAAMVSIIDVEAGVVARTVDFTKLGFSDEAKPHDVAVEPDGSHWYVSLIGDDVVLKFDRQNNLVGQASFERPGLMTLDPNSDYLWVGRSMKAINPPQRLGVIERSTMEIEEVDIFIPRPHAIVLGRDGNHVYSSSMSANQVVTVDTRTLEADLLTIPGQIHALVQFNVSPDGQTLVAGGHVSSMVLFFDLADPSKPVLFDSLKAHSMPWHPIYSADGRFLYFPNKGANSVTVYNARERSVAAIITGRGLAQPHGSALSLDGSKLFVSSANQDGSYTPRYDFGDNDRVGTVSIIDTESRRILKVIEIEENPSGMGAR